MRSNSLRRQEISGGTAADVVLQTTGAFEEVMLIRDQDDLALFKATYDIAGEIGKIY